jgi:NTE family protein
MKTRTALVLSGGGMFGAWQAGVWRALAPWFRPDLIVGASVGSLNGYVIAGGATPEELAELWLRPELTQWSSLPATIQDLMKRYPLCTDYAVVLTDLLRMKPRTFSGAEITWRHLAASCAVPFMRPQERIGGRWYSDGGLLNPVPAWAAVELGACRMVAVNVLPEIPSLWLKPFVKGFRRVAGHHPPLPEDVRMVTIQPDRTLGTMRDALHWQRENIERWLEEGYRAATNISLRNCLER